MTGMYRISSENKRDSFCSKKFCTLHTRFLPIFSVIDHKIFLNHFIDTHRGCWHHDKNYQLFSICTQRPRIRHPKFLHFFELRSHFRPFSLPAPSHYPFHPFVYAMGQLYRESIFSAHRCRQPKMG